MSIRAIFLDLDNTLYEYLPCHKIALVEVKKYFYQILDKNHSLAFDTLYSQASVLVKSRIQTHGSAHNRLLYFQNLLEICDLQAFPHALNMHHLYWRTFLKVMKPFPGMIEFVRWCKNNFGMVVVVTDLIADIQHQKIEKLGLSDDINYLVTSEEAGWEKPHPSIYELACLKAQVSFSEVIMIGDNIERDVEGARKIGLEALHFNNNFSEIQRHLSQYLNIGQGEL